MSSFLASAFYENDFDIDVARQERYPIWIGRLIVQRREEKERDIWNQVFTDRGCEQYKPRRYILKAFPQLEQSLLSGQSIHIVDLGCGAGATLLPILRMIDMTKTVNRQRRIEISGYDLSNVALESLSIQCDHLLEANCLLKESLGIRLAEWDLTKRFEESAIEFKLHGFMANRIRSSSSTTNIMNDFNLKEECESEENSTVTICLDMEGLPTKQLASVNEESNQIKSNQNLEGHEVQKQITPEADFGLMVFTLSAIDPVEQVQALRNASMQLKLGGLLMIRDYGSWDLIQVRTKKRVGEWTVEKEDGVLCTFYTIESLTSLVEHAGMELVEPPRYCTVKNTNRKEGKVMLRVFIRCVARRRLPPDE